MGTGATRTTAKRKHVHDFYRAAHFLWKFDDIMKQVQEGNAILISGQMRATHTHLMSSRTPGHPLEGMLQIWS